MRFDDLVWCYVLTWRDRPGASFKVWWGKIVLQEDKIFVICLKKFLGQNTFGENK